MLFGCPYWCYTTAGIKGILKKKKRHTQLVKESFQVYFIQLAVNDVFQFASVQYT